MLTNENFELTFPKFFDMLKAGRIDWILPSNNKD